MAQSITDEIASLSVLLLLQQRASYISKLKRIVDKLNEALPADVIDDIFGPPDINWPPGPDPSPLARSEILSHALKPLIISYLASGDPDGSPAKPIVTDLVKDLIEVHKSEIKSLERIQKRLK